MSQHQKSIWPKSPPAFVRAALAGHTALGLAFAALIYLVCFSGVFAVLMEEFKRWETPHLAPITSPAKVEAIDRVFSEARAINPDARAIYLNLPEPDIPRFLVSMQQPGGKGFGQWHVDAEGHILGQTRTPYTSFLTGLHIRLHLPSAIGGIIVGLSGIALLASLISGLLAHPRIFRDAFHLRWGGSKRLHEADLHNRIGVWALPFHVVLALSGALLGLGSLLAGLFAFVVFNGDMDRYADARRSPRLPENAAVITMPSVAGALATLEQVAPGRMIRYLNVDKPGRSDQLFLITADAPGTINPGDVYAFNRAGELVPGSGPKGTAGNAINRALGNAHFGWFGGLPLKLLYVALGASLCVLTATGVGIWLARRRDKGKPAPAWEKIWAITCWGQPLAYAATALASLIAPDVPAVSVWLTATIMPFALVTLKSRSRVSLVLRVGAAALLAVVAGAHIFMHGSAMADSVGWWMDACALIAAAGLVALPVAQLVRQRRTGQVRTT